MEATQDCTIFWYKISDVGIRNDEILKVTALKS